MDKKGAHNELFNKYNLLAKARRSLSPVIATVLLIALVLILAIIIFLWARGFISERIEKFPGQAIEDTCRNVNFDASYYTESGTPMLEIVNRGNVPIYGIGVKQKQSSGNSNMFSYNITVNVGGSGKAVVGDNINSDETSELIIYPQILGTVQGKSINKLYTCFEQGITKSLA